jgi:Spy/CpxP family protein refolding chaperone
MKPNRLPTLATAFACLLGAALAGAPAALADPPAGPGPGMMGPGMGMHPGMGDHMEMGGAMGMGEMHGEGHGMDHRGLQPHNAAVHFLKMADELGLDAGQVAKLRKLRDAWIENNAASEAHLAAAQDDLQTLLFADSIDRKAVENKLAEIGPIESQLWRAFAQQLLEIKEMLTDPQKAKLREFRQRHPMM